jgi:pheromone shutdown protein TraB
MLELCSMRPSFTAMLDSDLAYIDKQIAATLEKIARQRGVIEKIRALEVDTRKSERLLKFLQQTLADLRAIRRLIEDDLTDAKASSRF